MIKGHSSKEAERLLKKYGFNTIEEQKKKSVLVTFLAQFNNFLTLLLLGASVISFFIKDMLDGLLILAIVILNAIFGIYQEKKASDAIEALKDLTISKVRVVRDGQEIEVDSHYLVPGDIIFVEEGVKVPADAKIVQAINLELNEATLTGESLSVEKLVDDEIYMGTIVAKGRGYAAVKYTGMRTKFGQIAANLTHIKDVKTPLQKKIEGLASLIGIIAMTISIGVFGLAYVDGYDLFPGFLLAVSLVVAVVPEGLPAVMTITLAIGVKEMAKKKAIMRKLSAIEALGSVTIIASDKTGTLTANKMRVKEIYVDGNTYDEHKLPSLMNTPFSKLMLNGVLCSTASLVYLYDNDSYDVLGDPTEGAMLILAQHIGLMPDMIRRQWRLIEEEPFDSVTKKMTVKVVREDNAYAFTKGAFESIIQSSRSVLIGNKKINLTPEKIHELEVVSQKWSKKGLRVLAFAYQELDISPTLTGKNKQPLSEPVLISSDKKTGRDMIFLGMIAIHDPPRLEVKEAIKKAHDAGIKVVMITGDNAQTAEAIGISTGLINEGDEILTGTEIDDYSDKELLKILPAVKIFARTSPFHKARIVRLYQVLGEIVAVTGDGVNDAIALKEADVGIAMGIVGTDVARETADMIITDDNFATIVTAVEEGRNIIKNLKNAIKYLLGGNIAEALSLAAGLILNIPQLFYPIQLLYTNLITDGIPALSLGFSPRDEDVMEKKPDKDMRILNRFDMLYIILIGIIGTVVVMGTYYLFSRQTVLLGRTAAFCVVVCMQSFIFIDMWLSHRSVEHNLTKLKSGIFIMTFILSFVIQYLIVSVPAIAGVFKVQTVNSLTFVEFVGLSMVVWFGIKAVKLVFKPE